MSHLFEHSSAAQLSDVNESSNLDERQDFAKKICISKSAILLTPLAVDCLGFIMSKFVAKLKPTFSNSNQSFIAQFMPVQLRFNLVDANFLFTNSFNVNKCVSFELNELLADIEPNSNSIKYTSLLINDNKPIQSTQTDRSPEHDKLLIRPVVHSNLNDFLTSFNDSFNNFALNLNFKSRRSGGKPITSICALSSVFLLSEEIARVLTLPEFNIATKASPTTNSIQIQLTVNNSIIPESISYASALNLLKIGSVLIPHLLATLEQHTQHVKFQLNLINLDMKVVLIDTTAQLVQLHFKSELLTLKSNFKSDFMPGLASKCVHEFQTNLMIDMNQVLKNDSLSSKHLFSAKIDANKKLLDARFVIELVMDSSEKYVLNLIFPLVFKSELSTDSDQGFKWSLPGLMGYFYVDDLNKMQQLFDFGHLNLSFLSSLNLLEIRCNQFRFMKSRDIKQFSLSTIAAKILAPFKRQTDSTFNLKFKVNDARLSYFPEGFNSKSWLFFKLNNLSFEFEASIEQFTMKEAFKISIDKEKDLNSNRKQSYKNTIKLKKSVCQLISTTNNLLLSRFDFNKWINFACMQTNEPCDCRIQLIAALPTLSMEISYLSNLKSDNTTWNWMHKADNNLVIDPSLLKLVYLDLIGKYIEMFNDKTSYTPGIISNADAFLFDLNGNLIGPSELNYFDATKIAIFFHKLMCPFKLNFLLLDFNNLAQINNN